LHQNAVGAPSTAANLEQDLYRTGFDAVWEIDVLAACGDKADAGIEVSVEDGDILASLLGEVAKNYIDLRGAQRACRGALPTGGAAGHAHLTRALSS
jgi:hypothetical protein